MSLNISIRLIFMICAALGGSLASSHAHDFNQAWLAAASDQSNEDTKAKGGDQSKDSDADKSSAQDGDKKKEMTPEEKMQARFPQPAKVGHLIGLPVLDENDSTIGYVQQVVRTPEGKIQLIVPYAKQFGWMRDNALIGWSRRPVAVPIEVVAILALQINALEMDRGAFDKAPTWFSGQGSPIPADESVKIALGRR
jgi:hypothetical protein